MSAFTTEQPSPTVPSESQADPKETVGMIVCDTITENPFDSADSRILFDAVDQLQHCGASQHVDIPQLVIVGSQSTGKSSLLQSLTDIPFPVGAGCCTRFATRIVSRRTPPGTANKFKITIVDPEVRIEGFQYPKDEAYKEYAHAGETLGAEEFKTIMDEVSRDYMGIRSGKGTDKKNFATQVLRIELSGPGRSHFSIVDVPGLFTYAHTVNESEMGGVKNMILEYMRRPENLVICVADPMSDLSTQGIFHLAGNAVGDAAKDATRKRFIGVFTKCDMLQDPESAISTATGRDGSGAMPMRAWFVVRNRSSKDDKAFDLAKAEAELFAMPQWSEIPAERRGTGMLRTYLCDVLCAQIRRNFPHIQTRIQELLLEAQSSQQALGTPRPTHTDRLQYLRDTVQRYEILATKALEKPGLLDKELRVRNKVKTSNEDFAKLMHGSGHKHQFEDPDMDPVEEAMRLTAEFSLLAEEDDSSLRDEKTPFPFIGNGRLLTTPDLNDPRSLMNKKSTTSSLVFRAPTKDEIGKSLREDIREELRAFAGVQLPGLVNPEVMTVLYQKQTDKWRDFAVEHVERVAQHLGDVVQGILNRVCPPDASGPMAMHEGLLQVLVDLWKESKAKALAEVETFCHRERKHIMQTTDSRFYEKLKAWQTIRLLRSLASVPDKYDAAVIHNHIHSSIEDNMIHAVHDILKVYYQISIESFIRGITHNIVENFVSGSEDGAKGPLRGLSKEWVYSLSPEVVERIAREDEGIISKRADLDKRIEELVKADKIAQGAAEATRSLERL
ncbi:vacuolar sorting protein VPS1 [Xylariomycetidae sp. FL2044]|nr:vacuolar sorting protein VPS1 [Xylariomycetidae sp. FL2044]